MVKPARDPSVAPKCALIVDDSKTARRFLARILERYDMRVETAGSAEQALEFLGHDRPDVIFMDHMMPGMDGFEAVRAIKNKPATATIPIMMYTSQAGELYVSQARALGAVGVLPKQIKPVEVDALLQSLHLVDDESTDGASAEAPAVVPASVPDGAEVQRALRPADWDDLHRWLGEMLGHHGASLRGDIENSVAKLLDERFAAPVPAQVPRESRGRPSLTTFLVLLLAGLAATFFWLHQDSQRKWQAMAGQNSELLAALEDRRRADAEDAAGIRDYLDSERANLLRQYEDFLETLAWGINQSAVYEPGDVPLSDGRLEVVSGLMDRLRAVGYSGIVQLDVYTGNFCLRADSTGRWAPAPSESPADSCDRIGSVDGSRPSDLQSVAFANYRADLDLAGGPVRLIVEELGALASAAEYPASLQGVTAGDWNRVAAANNRVQLRLFPDTDLPAGTWGSASAL